MTDSDRPPERPRWQDLDGDEPAPDRAPPGDEAPAPTPREAPPTGDDPPAPRRAAGDDGPLPPPPEPGDRPRPPGAGQTPQNPYIKLTRWNPYQKLTPEGRRFVQELIRFPAVTVGIIVVLVLFYLWMVAVGWELTFLMPSRWGYDLALAFGALEPELVEAGEYWRLFTPALLHGSVLHLFVNSFMLYQLGRLAENVFGRLGLVVLFVGSAITGCLASAFIGDHMSIGASGAVMGLVGANIAFGAVHRSKIPEFLRGLFGPTLIVYFGIIFVMGLLPGIDFWGHLGGAVGGAAMGLVLPSQIGTAGADGDPAPPRGRWVVAPFALAVLVVIGSLSFMLPRAVAYDGDIAREAIRDFDDALEAQRLRQAAAALDRAEAAEPDSPWIQGQRELLANYAMVEEDWLLSSALLEQIDRSDPAFYDDRPSAQNNFAWSLFMSHPADPDRRGRGIALAQAALEKRQDDPVILNTLAWGLFLDGDYHGALGTIEQAMQENKGRHLDADIYIYVAALHFVGQHDEAVATYREAVTEHPDGVLHGEVAALLAHAEGDVELSHEQVLDVIETVSGVSAESEASGSGLQRDDEAIHGDGGGQGDRPSDGAVGADRAGQPVPPGAPDADRAPGASRDQAEGGGLDDDSADDSWRPPRAQWQSSRHAAEETVQ